MEGGVAFTHLQGECALGRCGHEVQGVEHVDVQVGEVEFQPVHACVGEHDGVVLSVAQFLDAGGHVAAQRFDAQVGLPSSSWFFRRMDEVPTTPPRWT